VIDAAGAIYVLGGFCNGVGSTNTHYKDVSVSTDGGEDLKPCSRGSPGVLRGH
jgi:hypothetical protein